ncbi:GNAT family N-acetyltransferase [Clostridium bowmanii]|uniref:GNAT family N-acetyltransferase n=1 Tax=Clostridium bowmanii TaxID=132925 RepID=UPI001C0AC338|nr:GNAT family N-acetyltransferase [Clostridium bowmanii]MBU3188677.1 GNAT family N-acetyltransferase [Clostridium bowmanii]MCA1073262.1 GNAT family N-acetyltransferase [Clostridium bowmanii]
MEIKQFNLISSLQKKELYNFIKCTDLTYNKTYIEMTKIYESDTFNEGNSVFVLFHKGKIRGSAALITKEISINGEAFITDICVEEENVGNENSYLKSKLKIPNTEMFLQLLIETVVKYCNKFSCKSIKAGIRESEIYLIPFINKLEFNHIYDAVIMRYKEDENMHLKVNKEIELRPLCILNSHEYMNIYNEAFESSPNGGTIDEVEVKDYIVQYANNEDMIGICYFEKKPCGIYELSMDGNTGWVDTLGITPKVQNSGLGSSLIIKCIEKLYEKKLNEIKLLVITSNNIAVKLYKNKGFEKESVFSYWFEKLI